MKKLLLCLGLLFIFGGCMLPFATPEEKALRQNRWNSLINNRVYIGMPQKEFIKIWPKPAYRLIQRSSSIIGLSEWWSYSWNCQPTYMYLDAHYHFNFDNHILTFWTEVN